MTHTEKFIDLGLGEFRSEKKSKSGCQRPDDDNDKRLEMRPRFNELMQRPDSKEIVQLLRHYIEECVPSPCLTERVWWSMTAMPRTKPRNRISCCNISGMEVCILYAHPNHEIGSRINVDGNRLFSAYREKDFRSKYPLTGIERRGSGNYKSAENATINTIALLTNGLTNIRSVLNDKAVLDAAYHLNWAVMCTGRVRYPQYHCYDLADLLLE